MEEKELIPESQTGFRKGRGTTDNIFILNHLIQREKKKEDKQAYIVSVDLKAAFDNGQKGDIEDYGEERN